MGAASAETRTLKLHFIHTNEKAEIVYKKNGRYIQSGLDKINRFLRDWRRNESTKMDPRLLDTVWEVYRASGSRSYITVISAYRSPATNSMLRGRSRSSGVAKSSQHMLGKAMDFYLPDVKLSKLRELGLKMGAGGVGYYPKSGSPFVHLDVGNVRHWPRMTRSQLLAVFPKGDTMHVPTDGKPLPGYKQALASYETRKRNGGSVQIASGSSRRSGGFLSALFGGGADDEEDSGEIAVASASPHARAQQSRRAQTPAAAVPEAPAQAETAPAEETPETIIAALPARSVPLPGSAPRQPSPDASAAMMAALAPTPNDNDARKAVEEAIAAGASVGNAPVLDAPFQRESEMAFNVPLPTHRPDYKFQPDGVTLPDSAPMLVASADRGATADGPTIAAVIAEEAAPSLAAAAVKSGEVSLEQLAQAAESDDGAETTSVADAATQATSEQVAKLATAYAAVPTARPGAREPGFPIRTTTASTDNGDDDEAASVVARNEVILSAADNRDRDGEAQPAQRLAMLDTQAGDSAATMMDLGVRTTAKSAKPRASQARAEPKAVSVPAQPGVARWALSGEAVARNTNGTKAPSFAYNIVRTAPREVYTNGFQQDDLSKKAHRFTGKAVEFLPVAQFNQN